MANYEEIDFNTLANFSREKNARQVDALEQLESGKVKFLLYGGALGGGKSYLLRWYGLKRLMWLAANGHEKATGMLACEDYPSLEDRQLQKIHVEFPPWLGRYYAKHGDYGRCFMLAPEYGGGVLCFRNLDDPSKYSSSEWAFILVDELTKNTFEKFTILRTRLRWPGLSDIDAQFVAGTNPGGIGHGWVKQFWLDKNFPIEWIKPIDYRDQFAYVPSLADDNPYLDASYWAMLETLPVNLREALRYGKWDIFVGQAFPEFVAAPGERSHVIDPIPVPRDAPIYMTFDWGYSRPFSIGWWWTDYDGRLYRFSEWYGCDGTPNQGIRLTDPEIARGIVQKEKVLKIEGRVEARYAGNDAFNRRPDVLGRGAGPPTSEIFALEGLYLTAGDDKDRLKKKRRFHDWLMFDENDKPMMMVYSTCKDFIRTIPTLVYDETNVEDVDTDGEDHVYDETCHMCLARPVPMQRKVPRKSDYDKRIDRLKKKIEDPYIEEALEASRQFERDFGIDDHDYGDMGEYVDEGEQFPDDGEMVETIQ